MKSDPYGTDDLFDPASYEGKRVTSQEKPKALKSVAQGNCPKCSREKVGLVQTNGHLMWRVHTYRTHGGTTLHCPAVGIYVCQLPEGLPTHSADGIPVTCPHGRHA